MKAKTSNAIDNLANIKLNKIRELSLVNPNLKSTVVMVREKVHEFNMRYYRPSEGDDIRNLYGDVIDFDKMIDDIFEENLPRSKENHIKVLVTSKPQIFKFKIKNRY